MKDIKGSLQDKIVFIKLKSGDSDAFAFFYDKYVKNIYRFVLIKVSDKRVAEDITQEVFLKTWQHLVDKRNIKSFPAFIFRIARNTVIDHYRRSDRQELPLEYAPEEDKDSGTIITDLDKSIDMDVLLKEIRNLKSEYQEVLLLRYVEDLSIDDVSQIMQKEKNNIRVLTHRALSRLKKNIAKN
ncbi:RNA polymerase sigma factor [Candidatus Parcubacteria bacterium]|jgi:RNA polymerase sigma-70 factor (ECF subfamily)|nr:RNA polymerase sigma factor [Candidatus Parcubacteria bacterium]MBT7228319.1 RNA polymerase sigma factor [Candidatus Parcubacteria bacterium]